MQTPDFVALQVTMLIRSHPAKSKDVELFLDSTEFKGAMQEKLALFLQESLRDYKIPFEEVIISLDRPAETVQSGGKPKSDKKSGWGRLFGG